MKLRYDSFPCETDIQGETAHPAGREKNPGNGKGTEGTLDIFSSLALSLKVALFLTSPLFQRAAGSVSSMCAFEGPNGLPDAYVAIQGVSSPRISHGRWRASPDCYFKAEQQTVKLRPGVSPLGGSQKRISQAAFPI